jgi:2-dehydro-3-deoxyphosphooctonate aldolase (KDO 8-P synthase)
MFFLMAGPCVVESKDLCFEVAEKVMTITNKFNIPYIFKASYRKANRSKGDSFTGIGDDKALEILKQVGSHFNIPTVTDIHESNEAAIASTVADVLQIPAFLCRQTDLLLASAKTGKHVNVKKGQFLSPDSMKFAVEKIRNAGNPNVILTERGTTFGYQDLVVDFRGIPVMKEFDVPVVMDVTHSLQQPNQSSGVTGGKPQMIETICKAAIAVGADGLFIETHPNPAKALSDGANMLQLDKLEELMEKLVKLRASLI